MYSILSSYNITGTLVSFTLGGATVLGTLGDVTVIDTLVGVAVGTYLGTTFVLGLFGCLVFMLLKSVANLSMAYYWHTLILKGFLGLGFLIICNNSFDALVTCSVVDNPGMMRCCVNNTTIYIFI